MKKLLVSLLVMGLTSFAQARAFCTVSAEEKPGEYTRNLTTKEVTISEAPQIIYQEGDVLYSVTRKATGDFSMIVYNSVLKKIHAAAVTKNAEFLVLLATDLGRSLACSPLETSK